jgi:hypothetical protein
MGRFVVAAALPACHPIFIPPGGGVVLYVPNLPILKGYVNTFQRLFF